MEREEYRESMIGEEYGQGEDGGQFSPPHEINENPLNRDTFMGDQENLHAESAYENPYQSCSPVYIHQTK